MTTSDTTSLPPNRTRLWLLAAIAVIVTGTALHFAAVVVAPVVVSAFVTLLVAPLDRRTARLVPEKLG